MQGLIFAILAAICWGLAPVAAKVALDQVSPVFALGVRSALATAIVAVWLVFSGDHFMMTPIQPKAVVFLLIEAILATVVGDALYFYALQYGNAVQVGLVMASSPVITIMAASFLLSEPLTFSRFIGTIVIVIGLVLITV